MGCRKASVVRPADVIAKLVRNGIANATETPFSKLDQLAGKPCPHCHGKRWKVGVLWHDGDGKAPVWRQDLDRR